MEPLKVKYERKVNLTDTKFYSLRVIDLEENPRYREASSQLASLMGLNVPDEQYEVMCIYMIDDHEVQSEYNERFNDYEEAKKLIRFIRRVINKNKEAIIEKKWDVDEPLIHFLITHRN